jgi:putative hydrolase of the HAD superfamily
MKINVQAFAFDLGGTLLEYEGLPPNWADFYGEAFNHANTALKLNLNKLEIDTAISMLKKYNPRINPRDIEFSSTYIFGEATSTWNLGNHSINEVAYCFYQYFQKRVKVFPDAVALLKFLRAQGFKIGILTDLPIGMPEEIIRESVALLECDIDCVLTSTGIGVRKPNSKGLETLAGAFGVTPKQIVFIGDEEKDILTARKIGAISIFINRIGIEKSFGEDIQINDLSVIKDMV